MQALEQVKRYALGRNDIEQWRNKTCSFRFCLPEGISEWVSESVGQSVSQSVSKPVSQSVSQSVENSVK